MLHKMKNYFLFAVLLVFSLYSVAALYQGTLNVGVGESPNVEIGEPPAVIVTDNGGSGSSSSSRDRGGSSGSSKPFIEVFNQTLKINEEGEIVEIQTSTNIEQGQTSQGIFSPITGAIIGFAKKPMTLLSMIFLILTLALTLIILKSKK